MFSFVLLCITVSLIAVLVLRVLNKKSECKSKLPAGPQGLYPLGNFLQIAKDPHLKFSQWAKQYGKLYTVYFGPRPAVVVNDSSLMKELFGSMASTGKFKTDTLMVISQGSYGILNTQGNEWHEQRQFCIKSMKEFGFGKQSIEPLVLRGVLEMCEWIENTSEFKSGAPLCVDHLLHQVTVNVLSSIVTGERIKLGDSEIGTLLHTFSNAMQYTMKTGLGFFPWMKYIAPELSGYIAFDKVCKDIHGYIQGKFEEHKGTYVEGARRDLMDIYIERLREVENNGKDNQCTFSGPVGVRNTVSTLVEVFISAGEATSASIHWALVYLSQNMEAQRKIQKEIDDVVGRERDPSIADKARMPFSEAVILESLRLSSVVPLGVFHELLEDVSFHGYELPKGIILVANMYHAHHNSEIWGDPEAFRPERFLSEEKSDLRDYLVPFQAGKRQCLAEPVARDELFLFVTKLLQQFHITPDPKFSSKDYLTPDVGLLLRPRPLGLTFRAR